jgi:hypothetical protein
MENSQNAGGSATPDLSASVQATKLSNPVGVASASESISSTPNEVDYSENSGSSKIDIGQWISIGIIGLTIVALVVQIVVARRTLIKLLGLRMLKVNKQPPDVPPNCNLSKNE